MLDHAYLTPSYPLYAGTVVLPSGTGKLLVARGLALFMRRGKSASVMSHLIFPNVEHVWSVEPSKNEMRCLPPTIPSVLNLTPPKPRALASLSMVNL